MYWQADGKSTAHQSPSRITSSDFFLQSPSQREGVNFLLEEFSNIFSNAKLNEKVASLWEGRDGPLIGLEPISPQKIFNTHSLFSFELQILHEDITVTAREFQIRSSVCFPSAWS